MRLFKGRDAVNRSWFFMGNNKIRNKKKRFFFWLRKTFLEKCKFYGNLTLTK